MKINDFLPIHFTFFSFANRNSEFLSAKKGSFSITNQSLKLPAEFKIECSEKVKLNLLEGRLEGNETKIITYQYSPHCYGYCQETVTIRNSFSPSQITAVTLCVFVDESWLKTRLENDEG